jgi:hypothetical protein
MGGGGAADSCIYRHVLHPKGRRKTLLFFNFPPSVMQKNRLQVNLSCLFFFNEFLNLENFAGLTENIKQYMTHSNGQPLVLINISLIKRIFLLFFLNIYQHSM